MQHRRLATAGERNPILDSHRTALSLIEHGTARVFAHCKNMMLPLFNLGARLLEHAYREIGCGYFLGRQYPVAVDRMVGTEIVVLKD